MNQNGSGNPDHGARTLAWPALVLLIQNTPFHACIKIKNKSPNRFFLHFFFLTLKPKFQTSSLSKKHLYYSFFPPPKIKTVLNHEQTKNTDEQQPRNPEKPRQPRFDLKTSELRHTRPHFPDSVAEKHDGHRKKS